MGSVPVAQLAAAFLPRGALDGVHGRVYEAHVKELGRIDDINTWQRVWQKPWARLLNLWYLIAL